MVVHFIFEFKVFISSVQVSLVEPSPAMHGVIICVGTGYYPAVVLNERLIFLFLLLCWYRLLFGTWKTTS